ncbi:NAD(P)H-binding protein [Chitinophaga sp. sic0106]|uniref:NAD(P)H-binding protein n=1 Tax=Chitinophaga sp. sic0106 TaxID=2854785 RepID=UPI001C468ECE|nr:NAD(P)H-binding protein [Chitinophaga sp. sic0106]MBV7533714.1 NAD(P)H-binding protein [Chitinophaga sp. sic0106]
MKNILVLGANGKTGRRVAARLQAFNVRLGSRNAPIPFDWEDNNTWAPALQDMDAVYISFQPDLAVPGADHTIAAFSKTAFAAGVQKLVLLSGRGEPEAERCEQAVIQSGIDWTIVRASWFMQNFTESYMAAPIEAGFVALPVGEVGEPFIDADDIADVAVAALIDNKHSQQIYEVTGPALLTFREAVAEIAKVTGRQIHYEGISMDEYTTQLALHGVPADITNLLTYLFTEVLDGRNATVANGVERALGRKPTDFFTFLKKSMP